MFDWFTDLRDKALGIDIDALKLEMKEREKEERKRYLIFSTKAKIWIITLLLIYITLSIFSIRLANASNELPSIIKNILMSAVAIFTIITLLIGSKTSEKLSVIGIFVFLFGLFVSMTLI